MSQTRQLAAIMFTDIVGYTALMGNNEQKAFELLRKNREIQKPVIEEFGGIWIKELGDGVMASFSSVSNAVYAALKIQDACNKANEFSLRIGIHQGEVVFENGDIFGDTVNTASRLENQSAPMKINISLDVMKELGDLYKYEDRGELEVKGKNKRECDPKTRLHSDKDRITDPFSKRVQPEGCERGEDEFGKPPDDPALHPGTNNKDRK